jgi:formylglycine-generating enzyme required for sulfatase activity
MAINRDERFATAAELRRVLRQVQEAEFEGPTVIPDKPKVQPPLPPTEPAPEPIIKTPEPAPASPPFAGTTVKSSEAEVAKFQPLQPTVKDAELVSPPVPPPVTTIRVDSPPSVPTKPDTPAPPTVAPPVEAQSLVGSRTRVAMIAAAVLVIVIIAVGLAAWRPWSRTTNSSDPANVALSNNQTSTSNTNSSSSHNAPAGMVYIPAADFTMGSNFGDEAERPPHQVTVKPFYIDIYEVTNQNYEQFVKATSHPAPSHWNNGTYPVGDVRKPVTNMNWDDANAYCKWAKKDLPTEEQWEFAARGTVSRVYPWGSDWKQNEANANGASTTVQDVGSYKGVSSFGLYDTVGNVWEWTRSDFRAYPGGRLPKDPSAVEKKVIRGGSFESKPEVATTTFRYGYPARGARYEQTGFRCAMDATQ